jgi:3-hydroxybutyryl-CoA dehydrogenase
MGVDDGPAAATGPRRARRGNLSRMSETIVGVAGAGFMGSGIAESAASAGSQVLVFEPGKGVLDKSRASIEKSAQKAVARGKLDSADELLERVSFHTDVDALTDADIVIEAVYEDPAVKGKLFRELDTKLPGAAILASNTSSIPIAQIASWTDTPERVLGLHFFSPVPVMKLVEIVIGLDTDPAKVQLADDFVKQLGKHPIHTKDRSGFIVNMLLVPYLMAAVRMYEDGFATREDIDDGMKLGAGHPMGPLTLCDFIGLDVLYAVCDSLYDEFKRPEYAPPPLLKRMVVSGHHGRKSGRGFYEY